MELTAPFLGLCVPKMDFDENHVFKDFSDFSVPQIEFYLNPSENL